MFYLTQHAKTRASERKITMKDIEMTLKRGTSYTMYDNKIKYQYMGTALIIEGHNIVTVYKVR